MSQISWGSGVYTDGRSRYKAKRLIASGRPFCGVSSIPGEFLRLLRGYSTSRGDHFPPSSISHRGIVCPACRECNIGLGNRWGLDFWARVEAAKDRIRRRHKKALSLPAWTEEQIAHLGPNLRRNVVLWQERRRIAHARLAWSVEAFLLNTAKNNSFAQAFVEFGITTESEQKLYG